MTVGEVMDTRCALCGEQIKELYTFPDGVVGFALCICDECKAAVAWARKWRNEEKELSKWLREAALHDIPPDDAMESWKRVLTRVLWSESIQ